MRFRPQRGSFKDSMEECTEVRSQAELQWLLDTLAFVEFAPSVFDAREPWNAPTFYAIAKLPSGERVIVGMTDSDKFDA